jgi:uncharacterized membrane protein
MTTSTCPKCNAAVNPGETYCGSCGYSLKSQPGDFRKIAEKIELKQAKQSYQGKIRSGRRTIMSCAVLFTLGTVAIYFLLTSQIDKQRKEVAAAKGNSRFDQEKVAAAEKELDAAQGRTVFVTAAHGVLALAYYALWWWAKTRPLPATLSALILFIAVQMLNIALDPESLAKGILIKILILAALISAVNAAQKYQKMTQQGV